MFITISTCRAQPSCWLSLLPLSECGDYPRSCSASPPRPGPGPTATSCCRPSLTISPAGSEYQMKAGAGRDTDCYTIPGSTTEQFSWTSPETPCMSGPWTNCSKVDKFIFSEQT